MKQLENQKREVACLVFSCFNLKYLGNLYPRSCMGRNITLSESPMSGIDDSIFREFLEESLDHLEGIEEDLLQIEADGAQINDELVNKVFRAVHSIKGGAGFLGLVKITRLCHAQESILNQIRKGELIPAPEISSALFTGLDLVRTMLRHWEDMESMEIEAAMQDLNAVLGIAEEAAVRVNASASLQGFANTAPSPIAEAGHEPLNQRRLQELRRKGFWIYHIRLENCDGMEISAETAKKFQYNLQNTGTVLQAQPSLDEINLLAGQGKCPTPMEIYYATVLDKEMLAELLGLPGARIELVDTGDAPKENLSGLKLPEELTDRELEKPQQKPEVSLADKVQKTASSASPKIAQPSQTSQAMTTSPREKDGDEGSGADSKIKVSLGVLDNLMAMAGELVLARNQLLQNLDSKDFSAIEKSAQQVNFITSELQMAIMSTRMQPVGNIFGKFKRVVRDLSKALGKEIRLTVTGEHVELDKTIIESIGDPLTHIIRNSADHGIENPSERLAKGKPAEGHIQLQARHEAGQVVLEIIDDGKGIDPNKIRTKALERGLITDAAAEKMSDKELVNLVFHPGFSLAEKVTDFSGRGVGMDVVHTNFSRLGGVVEINSKLGEGTTLQIKLPLTLAIIPGLMTRVGDEVFAIPQVNLQELVRIAPDNIKKRVQKVGDAVLLRLRDDLIPLFGVRQILEIVTHFKDAETGELKEDKRHNFWDRRQSNSEVSPDVKIQRKNAGDRRARLTGSLNIAVVVTGSVRFGLVVDSFLDTEEVVVKPMGQHIKGCSIYAGATILGDGRPALILDVRGIAERWLNASIMEKADAKKTVEVTAAQDTQSLLIVQGAPGQYFAAPLGMIQRIEMFPSNQVEKVGNKRHIQYRNNILPLFTVDDVAQVKPLPEQNHYYAIIYRVAGKEVGLMISEIVDTVNTVARVDEDAYQQPGIVGTSIIEGRTTLMLDLYTIVTTLHPEWGKSIKQVNRNTHHSVLVVDDSSFFLGQVKKFVEESGYRAITAENGLEALQRLEEEGDAIGLVLTDVEMPRMDGLELTRKIRGDKRFSSLPVIAITSLVGHDAEKRGMEAGVSEYMVKLDRERIIGRIEHYLAGN